MIVLIFSCNRALQLQTLLRSLATYLTVDDDYTVQVLYAATDERFEVGYQLLRATYPAIRFHRERQQRHWAWPRPTRYWKNQYRYVRHARLRQVSNFRRRVEQLIADSPHEGVLFLTDDSLFTRPVHIDAARLADVLGDSTRTYSLRHGLTVRPSPVDYQQYESGRYSWNVPANVPDLNHWTWRFSVDGHLYQRRALLPILRRLHYADPNSLEGFVNEYVANVRPDLFSRLLFDAQPSLVGFTLNKVQTFNDNRSFEVSPTYLNDRLLAGYVLRYVYEEPVTAFQPVLIAIDLTNPVTGDSETLPMPQHVPTASYVPAS